MTNPDCFSEIESHKFAARVEVGGSFDLLVKAAGSEESVRDLLARLDSNPEICYAVLQRVLELSQRSPDFRYENPFDTPMTIYLWLLTLTDLALSKMAAEAIIHAPRCWWAAKLANNVLLDQHLRSNSPLQSLPLEVIENIDSIETIQSSKLFINGFFESYFIIDIKDPITNNESGTRNFPSYQPVSRSKSASSV